MTAAALLALEVSDSGEVRGMPKSGRLVVGSDPAADLALDDPTVAPRHCVIARTGGGRWALRDLESGGGTFVNGAKVERKLLFAGDDVRVGRTHLRVVDLNEPPDERLAGFRIERPLGRGSMGEVYLAVQESLQRRVALKVLSEELAGDRAFIRQFQQEARAAAALNHPNVVHVYDVGEDDGRHWLAMEFMEGGNLEDLVARLGPRPWPEVVRILREAARGLVFAAERKIVHRDIKPANLMRDASGTVKIADLGLALSERSSPEERVYGTPQFVAPEQARGEAVDARADLYSLGATAWRLLTGRPLFEGRTTLEILRNKMNLEAPLLSEHLEAVPPQLEDLVADLLERDPADRPPSAAALLERLEGLGSDGARPSGGRRPLLWIAGSIAAVAAIAAAVWLTWPRPAPLATEGDAEADAQSEAEVATRAAPDLPELAVEPEAPPVRSDDASLAALEADAQRALEDLERRGRSGTVDAAEWRAHAQAFAGTDAGRRALREADAIEGSVRERAEEDADLTRQLDELRSSLGAAETTLAGRLAVLLAAPSTDVPLAPDRARAWLTDLGRQWIADAGEAATRRLAEVDRLREAERFDEAEAALRELLSGFEVAEDFDAGRLAPEWTLYAQRETAVRERLAALPAERAAAERARVLGDQQTVARELTGPESIERDLRTLDLDRAAERLRALSARLDTAPAAAVVERWAAEVDLAREAVDLLVRTHREDSWRRRALSDPRGGGAAEVLDLDDVSVTLEVDGRAERLPWEVFARTETLHQLFNGRLDRAYTGDELRSVAALMRLAATLELVEAARAELLEGRPSPTLSGPELNSAFALLEQWSEAESLDAAAREAAAREARARDLLLRTAADLEGERYGSAAFVLERLLAEYADTWTVLLLSDGRREEGALIPAAWDSGSGSD